MPLDILGNKIISVSTTTQGIYKSRISRDRLVFYVDAADLNSYPGSGAIWYDLSGNGYNGTLYNSPTYNASPGSISFNGSTQYMQANVTTTSLDGDPIFSVEMFVKRTATLTGGTGGYWGIGGAGVNLSFEGWTPNDNLICLDCYASTRTGAGTTYPLNTYVHVVWVKHAPSGSNNTNVVICYINGVPGTLTNFISGSQATLNTSSAGKGICIGRINGDSNSLYGQCDMAVFRVYNKALNSLEVAENFQANRGRFGI